MAGNAGLNSRAWLYALIALLLAVIGGGAYFAGLVPDLSARLPETVRSSEPAVGSEAVQTPKPAGAPDTAAVATDTPVPQEDAEQPADTAADDSAPATQTDEQTESLTDGTDTQAAQTQIERESAEPAALPVPVFDVVRVDPDGSAVVAGTAAPGAVVSFLLDDREIGTAVAGSDGKFAGFFSVDLGQQARVLTMLSELGDQVAASDDQIILAPVAPATTEVASADEPAETPMPITSTETAQTDQPSTETTAATDTAATEPDAPETAVANVADTGAKPEAQSETAQPAPETTRTEPVETAEVQGSAPAPDEGADRTAAAEPTQTPAAPPESAETSETQPAPEQVAQAEPQAEDAAAPASTASQSIAAATDAANAATDGQTETAALTEQPQATPAPAPAEVATSVPQVAETPKADDTSGATVPEAEATPEPAPAAVAVLKAGRDGVELLNPDTPQRPEAMVSIALDTIGYSETGDVLLSGRSRGQSVVRVYVNNSAVTDLNADDAGKWKGQIEGIDPGVYTLRLDELGQGGKVLSRLETPFKREAPEVLNPPQPETAPSQTPLIRAVTVQKGDTLWAISRDRYGDGLLYVRVFEANRDHIRNPDLIYPGQVFKIPE